MKFNGPAPEIINSRLAMVGFLAGTVRETHTGEPLLQQVGAVLGHKVAGSITRMPPCLRAGPSWSPSMVALYGAKTAAYDCEAVWG